jgi:hypothetical protein
MFICTCMLFVSSKADYLDIAIVKYSVYKIIVCVCIYTQYHLHVHVSAGQYKQL